jgi:hypothetical protein
MEIKLELDTEKASKAAMVITSAYRLCRVFMGTTEYPQLTRANVIALIIIFAILYGPHPAPKITKSA